MSWDRELLPFENPQNDRPGLLHAYDGSLGRVNIAELRTSASLFG